MELVLKKDEQAVFALRKIYEQYGYLPYKMNRFEEYELYVRNKDFLVSDRVITFSDRDGRLLALKPDVTLSIIKNVQNLDGGVQKLYYNENVYRPQKSDQCFKEILQAGLECLGDLGDYETREVVLLAMKSLEALGHPFILDVSHMGLIGSVLERSGLTGEQKNKAMLYLRQKNCHEMKQLCSQTECENTDLLIAFTQIYGNPDQVLAEIEPLLYTQSEKDACKELSGICKMLSDLGYGDNIRVDFSVGSDMKYYSGVVFKGYLEGLPAGILSGGVYDKLLKKMGKPGKAIGFALYLDMLERYEENDAGNFVDTVLLYENTANAEELTKVCESLRKEGSLLVCRVVPTNYKWERLMKYVNGEAVKIESNA